MKPALLLIDLQEDYLRDPALLPHRDTIVRGAARLLKHCRSASVPVFHVHTIVTRTPDNRMPHWRHEEKWICVEGTTGSLSPTELAPMEKERVVCKQGYSGFTNLDLTESLRALDVDTVVIAGIHSHACVRATAVDAYQMGFDVRIACDAIGTNDPIHGAITLRYLEKRGVHIEASDQILSAKPSIRGRTRPGPSGSGDALPTVIPAGADEVDLAANRCLDACHKWRATPSCERISLIRRLIDLPESRRDEILKLLVHDIGKPIAQARGEIAYGMGLAECAINTFEDRKSHANVKRVPHGVVAVVTPWNNAFAIPLGKIVPALLYGNGVLWKPSPAGTGVAELMMECFEEAGIPEHLVSLAVGGSRTGELLMNHPEVSAISLTGGPEAGWRASEIAVRRMVPLQMELGGNNAAILWRDTHLHHDVEAIVRGAFGFAGQRCTANRRMIVPEDRFDEILSTVSRVAESLVVGDPSSETTFVGPMISAAAAERVRELLKSCDDQGLVVLQPHRAAEIACESLYVPPAIVVTDDPASEIVQEETFGPVLVIQPAKDWSHAVSLCNGVRQGLAAALFSDDEALIEDFLSRAEAGILRINQATDGAEPRLPFGGWKASGAGPPEHGEGDMEFYTRYQTIYRPAPSGRRNTE